MRPAAAAATSAPTFSPSSRRWSIWLYRRANRGAHIAFAAPGVGVPTAASVRGLRPQTDTSFAVPFVTAALTLTRRQEPGIDLDGALERLARTAEDLGPPGRDPLYGWGLVRFDGDCVENGIARPSYRVAEPPPD